MFDWNWLWVAGELGITYGFYRWWKSEDTYATILAVAPDIEINDLQRYASSKTFIDYAAVHGIVRANDSKASSVLQSQFLPHCLGVIHSITLREKKLERVKEAWSERSKILSHVTRHVPFRLTSPSGSYIHIDKPLLFSTIKDELETVHIKFEQNTSSSLNKIVDVVLGDLSTGLETEERMLLIDATLTGVGRLEKGPNGIWRLVPHQKWGGILTRSSRAEILSSYQGRSSLAKVLCICFAVVTAGTAAYLLYQHYSKQQERNRNQFPDTLPTDSNISPRIRCIICLENETVYNLQPCSHIGLCHTCAQTLQGKNHSEQICPLCRVPIEEYKRIFIP